MVYFAGNGWAASDISLQVLDFAASGWNLTRPRNWVTASGFAASAHTPFLNSHFVLIYSTVEFQHAFIFYIISFYTKLMKANNRRVVIYISPSEMGVFRRSAAEIEKNDFKVNEVQQSNEFLLSYQYVGVG